MIDELVRRCEENDVKLTTTSRLTEAVVESGYSATYGARPLRRAVQRCGNLCVRAAHCTEAAESDPQSRWSCDAPVLCAVCTRAPAG